MARSSALDAISEAAIEWMVELRSGKVGAAERAAFEQWLLKDSRHRQAWLRLGGALEATFGATSAGRATTAGPRAPAVQATLQKADGLPDRRRMLRGALGVAGLGLGSAWLAERCGMLPDWRADLHTATRERRSFELADGSRLQLDARSSADVRFSAGLRLIHLRQGQLLATVQAGVSAPFVVRSPHGSMQALGSRIMMKLADERTFALALKGEAALTTGSDARLSQLLSQGQSAWFDGRAFSELRRQTLPDAAAAWERGEIHAYDQPLGEVLASLRPYRRGLIRVSPGAAQLRVTGVFALDDTDAALESLAQTLPIDVHRHSGGWLVRVDTST